MNNFTIKETPIKDLVIIEPKVFGDHAVKSPWGNWQFGINEFYNNWQGRYKGHGDKVNRAGSKIP